MSRACNIPMCAHLPCLTEKGFRWRRQKGTHIFPHSIVHQFIIGTVISFTVENSTSAMKFSTLYGGSMRCLCHGNLCEATGTLFRHSLSTGKARGKKQQLHSVRNHREQSVKMGGERASSLHHPHPSKPIGFFRLPPIRPKSA